MQGSVALCLQRPGLRDTAHGPLCYVHVPVCVHVRLSAATAGDTGQTVGTAPNPGG